MEAPRGTLYHRYKLDPRGFVEDVRIIAPTNQNLARIEQDLYDLVAGMAGEPDGKIAHSCEMAVRNYDPCISCATHCVIRQKSM